MAATDMARGLLMPMLTMVATAMVDTAMARGPLRLTMAAMDMAAMAATAMARGPLMLTMVATDMAAMAATAMASNFANQENHAPKKQFPKSKFLQFTLDLSNIYLGLNQIQFSF